MRMCLQYVDNVDTIRLPPRQRDLEGRRRREESKKRELLVIIHSVEPINQGACCSEFPTYQFFIFTLLRICEQTTEGLQNYLSTIIVNKKTCHEMFALFG